MEVGALLRRRAKEEGFSRQQLVEHLGYQNANKGLRRVDAMFGGKKPGLLRQRLCELLRVTDEVADIIDAAESRSQELQVEADAELDLLEQYREALIEHARQIAADEDLRLALPSEDAVMDVAYLGTRHLPLGALLERWRSQRNLPRQKRHYIVGGGGSPLSGSGSMWGFVEDEDGLVSRQFKGKLALAILQHPLVEPFQARLASGDFLRIGQVIEKLGPK